MLAEPRPQLKLLHQHPDLGPLHLHPRRVRSNYALHGQNRTQGWSAHAVQQVGSTSEGRLHACGVSKRAVCCLQQCWPACCHLRAAPDAHLGVMRVCIETPEEVAQALVACSCHACQVIGRPYQPRLVDGLVLRCVPAVPAVLALVIRRYLANNSRDLGQRCALCWCGGSSSSRAAHCWPTGACKVLGCFNEAAALLSCCQANFCHPRPDAPARFCLCPASSSPS